MGKYAALTAMGTFMILNPQKAQAVSGPPFPPGQDFGGSNVRGVRIDRNKK